LRTVSRAVGRKMHGEVDRERWNRPCDLRRWRPGCRSLSVSENETNSAIALPSVKYVSKFRRCRVPSRETAGDRVIDVVWERSLDPPRGGAGRAEDHDSVAGSTSAPVGHPAERPCRTSAPRPARGFMYD
jgi:hypothetical protein